MGLRGWILGWVDLGRGEMGERGWVVSDCVGFRQRKNLLDVFGWEVWVSGRVLVLSIRVLLLVLFWIFLCVCVCVCVCFESFLVLGKAWYEAFNIRVWSAGSRRYDLFSFSFDFDLLLQFGTIEILFWAVTMIMMCPLFRFVVLFLPLLNAMVPSSPAINFDLLCWTLIMAL